MVTINICHVSAESVRRKILSRSGDGDAVVPTASAPPESLAWIHLISPVPQTAMMSQTTACGLISVSYRTAQLFCISKTGWYSDNSAHFCFFTFPPTGKATLELLFSVTLLTPFPPPTGFPCSELLWWVCSSSTIFGKFLGQNFPFWSSHVKAPVLLLLLFFFGGGRKEKETPIRKEGKRKVGKMRIINLHFCKVQSSWQRGSIYIILKRRKCTPTFRQWYHKLSLFSFFFFAFMYFQDFFFCNKQIIQGIKKKNNEAILKQKEKVKSQGWWVWFFYFSLFPSPKQAWHSSRVAMGRGSETEDSEAAQSQDFWQSRFSYSFLPAPNPTLTHFTAPTFNLPNATKSAN